MTKKTSLFSNLNSDFPAGLVVFLVALPLCLGIALASGAPLFSGIISGVIGGLVVGLLSNSHLSVSGPAAGLTAIVLTAISTLGNFQLFLSAVFIAGLIQVLLGFIKAGSISSYFPNNVIEGMLAGIGVIIFMKQIPHAVGYDKDYEGDLTFMQADGENTFSELFAIFNSIQIGAVVIAIVSLFILILWNKIPVLKNLKLVPGALVAVVSGIIINQIFIATNSNLAISGDHLVQLPVPKSIEEFKAIFIFPDFNGVSNTNVWTVAFTIAIVASIETLLCIEAADKMDKHKRYTDTNIELKAQGIGNMLSALLGGLPMTSVVVRTSANASAGAESKMAAIIHGVLLLVCGVSIPFLLNKIPLATLAAILLLIGYKLAVPNIKHFTKSIPQSINVLVILCICLKIAVENKHFTKIPCYIISGLILVSAFYIIKKWLSDANFKEKIIRNQSLYFPFIATIIAVIFTDLLKGVALGIVVSILFILRENMKRAYSLKTETLKENDIIHIELAQEVSFLNKAAIKSTLANIPENTSLIINASDTVYIAHDVLDLIKDFKKVRSKENNIKVELIGFKKSYGIENSIEDEHVFVEHKN